MDPNEPQEPQEPTLPSAEQMRARRLAKLGGAVASSPSSQASSAASESGNETAGLKDTQEAPSGEAVGATPVPASATKHRTSDIPTSTSSSPVPTRAMSATTPGQTPEQRQEQEQGTDRRTPTEPPTKRAQMDIDDMALAAKRPQKMPRHETFEEWADKSISHFFHVSVNPDRRKDTAGHALLFLPEQNSELTEAGAPLRLSPDSLDQIILEAATAFPHSKPLLEYLLPCWKRIVKASKMQRDPSPKKLEMLREAKRLCMSNSLFALTMPDLFGREENAKHDTIVPYLLKDLDHESGMCLEFVTEAATRFAEDETAEAVFVNAIVDISHTLSKKTMADDYKPYVNALILFSKYKDLMTAVARHPLFLPDQISAAEIEKSSLFGPFFRLSPLQQDVAKVYFANASTLDEGRVKSSQNALQITLSSLQMDLLVIINNFVRASEEVRNRVLDWFARIVNVNHKRSAIHVHAGEVSSDGFMLNVTAVVDGLCQPFIDSTFSKISRIDTDYFRRQPRVDISDETKLNADKSQSDAFYANEAAGTSNFISEVFFLALAAHNYGPQTAGEKIKHLDRAADSFRRALEAHETDRQRYLNNQAYLAIFDARMKKYREALETTMALKHATTGLLNDDKMQAKSLQFMRYVAVWLVRVASRTDFVPEKSLKVPLSSPPPEAWNCLPEYSLQIIIENFKYVFTHIPGILLSSVGDELMVLCVTFLESADYVRNPYLKSGLVTLLYFGVTQFYSNWKSGVMTDTLTNSKFANEYLLHALMKFYIDCEQTGAHNAFYDKFNIRFEIFYVIQKVWTNSHYHHQLIQQSTSNREFFVRFVNLLLNDATYVLDEALGKFHKIHELQVQLKTAELSEEERQAKQEELKTVESHATSFMHLTNQTISMMKLFTEALGDSFTMPEIVHRLAGMLDYNLETLVGPKSSRLKVENPTQYRFDPKTLLTQIVDIYLSLGTKPAFIEAVASDGRSYKPETFSAASRILSARMIADTHKLAAWKKLTDKFAAAKELADQAELDFGEIPAEFEDPLMSDLMKDPVRLPSGNIVDRSTIVQHLLSDPKDPFTRQPMTIDDVVPQDDLRQKIEEWKAERMQASKHKLAAIAADPGAADSGSADVMDTTDG